MRTEPQAGQRRFAWEEQPPPDPYLHWQVRRSTLYAFILSLIVHGLVLFGVPRQPVGSGEPSENGRNSLTIRLRPSGSGQAVPSAPVPLAEAPPPPAPRRPPSRTPPVLATKSPESRLSRPAEPVKPLPPVPPATDAPTDMQSYIDARRARRAAEGLPVGAAGGSPGPGREPTEDEIRMANVRRNLTVGTSGIFQIVSIESRSAAFTFRGWTTDSSNVRREFIQVEIGNNSNIEVAVVRKMIELIRRYYKGDFNWESQRLDRVVVLSARIEDNEGLEAFMLKEFFGEPPRRTTFR